MDTITNIEHINAMFNTKTDLVESDLNEDIIKSLEYTGPFAYSVGWNEHKTIEALSYFKTINVTGARAGTSLRFILMKLVSPEHGVNMQSTTFLDILDCYTRYDVSERYIKRTFGRAGDDLWELIKAYKEGILTNNGSNIE